MSSSPFQSHRCGSEIFYTIEGKRIETEPTASEQKIDQIISYGATISSIVGATMGIGYALSTNQRDASSIVCSSVIGGLFGNIIGVIGLIAWSRHTGLQEHSKIGIQTKDGTRLFVTIKGN